MNISFTVDEFKKPTKTAAPQQIQFLQFGLFEFKGDFFEAVTSRSLKVVYM